MRRSAKILLLALIVALLPLRSIAAAMAGPCLAGPEQTAAQSMLHAQDSHTGLVNTDSPFCRICVGHCPNAAFAPDAGRPTISSPSGERGIPPAEQGATAFVPDQPDRPPLALFR